MPEIKDHKYIKSVKYYSGLKNNNYDKKNHIDFICKSYLEKKIVSIKMPNGDPSSLVLWGLEDEG